MIIVLGIFYKYSGLFFYDLKILKKHYVKEHNKKYIFYLVTTPPSEIIKKENDEKLVLLGSNFGLSSLDNTKTVIPFSVDYQNFIILKKVLYYCERKYNMAEKKSLKDFNISYDSYVPLELSSCLKLYNFRENKEGYYLKLSCPSIEDKILIGKLPKNCIKLKVLGVIGKRREMCDLTFCS